MHAKVLFTNAERADREKGLKIVKKGENGIQIALITVVSNYNAESAFLAHSGTACNNGSISIHYNHRRRRDFSQVGGGACPGGGGGYSDVVWTGVRGSLQTRTHL